MSTILDKFIIAVKAEKDGFVKLDNANKDLIPKKLSYDSANSVLLLAEKNLHNAKTISFINTIMKKYNFNNNVYNEYL